ncbi:histidinol-phosphatase [Mycoplasmopsis cricetuli]|uniref:histidinol-phosphatase n=1 Tax=Mycoplasmopsis cricetuli TaxID=171283 RepID=UPI0004718E82|nr:histidinol-phosphatase [Mycoplasmopsis cricetuli]
MKYDYHNHTYYCNHSDTTVSELVEHYVSLNYKEIGISDHIPYPGELDLKDPSRMRHDQMESYIQLVKEQKEIYKNNPNLKIYTGFESEYFPTQKKWYESLLKREDVDYLILGIHAVDNLDPENNYNTKCTNKKELQRYWNALNEGMRTGLFLYAVHPDFYMKSYEKWDQDCAELAYKICDLALELDFPIGFNINGFWKGPRKIGNSYRNKYPMPEFWEIVRERKVKILLESDTHHKAQLYDDKIVQKTYKLLKEWKIDHLLVEKVNMNKYKQKVAKILNK